MSAPLDRPPRILHVCQATVTGLALFVSDLAGHQRRAGIDARVACPSQGPLAERVHAEGVPLVPWEATRQPGPSLPRECRSLAAIIAEVDPDVVHLTSAKAGLVGRLVLRGRRPTLFSPQAWSFLVPGWTSVASRRWEALGARWATLILACCEEEAQAGRAAGVHGRYAVVENGVDPSRFVPADGTAQAAARAELGYPGDTSPWAACVGRLSYQKGQKPLVQAWADVRRAVPEARLFLLGDGEDEAELRAMDPGGVEILGLRGDIHQWLAAVDLAVQPSRYEGFSFAVLEAMSAGRSVVAFDAIGMRTALGEEAGAIVPIDDRSALADAIVARLRDPQLRAREGHAGRERVCTHFTLDRLRRDATARTLELMTTTATRAAAR